jgi:hypothetical protein
LCLLLSFLWEAYRDCFHVFLSLCVFFFVLFSSGFARGGLVTHTDGGWKIKLIIFVGGTSGSVHSQTLNDNLKELQVIESKRDAIRKGLVYELLNAQDTVLCSYFAQRSGERSERQNQGGASDEVFQGLGNFD